MSVSFHPPRELLSAYVDGGLPTAPGLVVAAHLGFCPMCRGAVGRLELDAGARLATITPAPLSPGALDAALARARGPAAEPARRPDPRLPTVIGHAEVGRSLRFPNGLWIAPVRAQRRQGWRINLIGGPGGAVLPEHDHQGTEYTCVLEGVLMDCGVVYGAGDFMTADQQVTGHRLQVGAAAPCVCIVATSRPARYRGALGWVSPLLNL